MPVGLRACGMCLPGPRRHGPLDWYGSFAPRRLLRPDPHTGVPSALPCAHPRFAGFSPHPRSRFRPHPDHSLQAQAFAPRPLCRRYSIDCVPHEAVARAGRREPWRGDLVPASRWRRAQWGSGAARSDFGGFRVKGNVGRAGTSMYAAWMVSQGWSVADRKYSPDCVPQ